MIGVLATGGLYVVARVGAARLLGPNTLIDAPPFFGVLVPLVSLRVLFPVAVALAVMVVASRRHRVSWHTVLVAAVLGALAWSASLAVADNVGRLTAELRSPPDYLNGLRAVGNHPGSYLATFADRARGPVDEVIRNGYPTHVEGHPPGAVLTLWVLGRVGLANVAGGVLLVLAGQAAVVVGVLGTARRVAGEAVARLVAPFVVLLPAAVWSHTLDTFFAGVAALAILCTVAALDGDRTPQGRRVVIWWAVAGGVLFGYLAFLSYGLVVMALVPLAVALRWRRVRPLGIVAAAALGTMAIPVAWGFSWRGGFAATHFMYKTTIAAIRPYGYFVWADVVVAAVAVGAATVGGLLLARPGGGSPRWRGLAPLVLGGLAALAAATLSGMAKGETERIFQPIFPWLALAAVALVAAERRRGATQAGALAVQAAGAITLAVCLQSPW